MFAVARDFSFSYGHRLYRYQGKCQRLHGHNARVRIELGAHALNEQNMALDFVQIKSTLGRWIDETLDHRVFLAQDDPLAEQLRAYDHEPILVQGNPTAEILAKMIYDYARNCGFNVLSVRFWETDNCCATYQGD